jgi:DNA primase
MWRRKEMSENKLNDELSLLIAAAANFYLYPKLRASLAIDDFDDPDARELFIALEECFRDNRRNIIDLKKRISNEALGNFVIQQAVLHKYYINPEKLANDGIRNIRKKRLERRSDEIILELKGAKPEQSPGKDRGFVFEDLLSEKALVDAELRLLL